MGIERRGARLIGLMGVAGIVSPGAAQPAASRLSDGTAAGFTIGALTVDGRAVALGAFQLVGLRANRIGYSFSVYLPVSGSGFGMLPAAGLTYNLALKDATIVFKAGPILVAGFAGGESSVRFGAQAGVGLIQRIGAGTGLFIDLTPQRFWGDGESITVVALGVGFVGLPKHPE